MVRVLLIMALVAITASDADAFGGRRRARRQQSAACCQPVAACCEQTVACCDQQTRTVEMIPVPSQARQMPSGLAPAPAPLQLPKN